MQFGSEIALDRLSGSPKFGDGAGSPETVGDLFDIWTAQPPKSFTMVRTACSALSAYLSVPVTQLTLADIARSKDGFRDFLSSRHYAENTIRTYVNHVTILLNEAMAHGWDSENSVSPKWRGLVALAREKNCTAITMHFARVCEGPEELDDSALDEWLRLRVGQGKKLRAIKSMRWRFLHLLNDTGMLPPHLAYSRRPPRYGISTAKLPAELKSEVLELLRWKQAPFALDRPKAAKVRPVSAGHIESTLQLLIGFCHNCCEERTLTSLSEIFQKRVVERWVEFCLVERGMKGGTIHLYIRNLSATFRQHPKYNSLDFKWVKPLLNSIPLEPASEVQERKLAKLLEYDVVDAIPDQLREKRLNAQKYGLAEAAQLASDELLVRFLLTLAWRQRNVRECRISGPKPNLFKSKIPVVTDIQRPKWVIDEQRRNPAATFWQFHFSPEETKKGFKVSALLPKQLIGPLEEYLELYRPSLITGRDPLTLFVSETGVAMDKKQVIDTVSELTLRYGGRIVTPHHFRDVVAYTWLREHPQDYLTLSKLLWHRTVSITLQIYGGRFNESSGVCAMESWLEQREENKHNPQQKGGKK